MVIGTAGLFSFVGREPVMATQIIQGFGVMTLVQYLGLEFLIYNRWAKV
jgi:hypothetical protein